MYHVCVKKVPDKVLVPDEAPSYYPLGYYYQNIELKSGKDNQAPGIKPLVYDGLSNNCVQVSMKVLLKGTFYEDYMIYA